MAAEDHPTARRRRPPLDFVSPLPPVRSGIADYSVDLLPHLIEQAGGFASGRGSREGSGGVRVLGLPGQPVDPEVAERFGVVSPDEWASTDIGRSGRLPLYQMGNNRYHEEVERMALVRPGVLTLHDLVLHHLLSEEHLSERDFRGYRERLAAEHGWIGEEAARPREWGAAVQAMLFELPAHRTLLRRQRGVLVHNRWAAERIAREDPEIRVRVVPMGVPLPPPADRERGLALRRRLGIPDDAPVVGSFGFQTPIKRTDRVVEALAAPELDRAHLLVVGETPRDGRRNAEGGDDGAGGPRALEDLAAELGVADRVHVTGFVPWEELEAGMAACDLCLNLRYPTAGETSASLLRVLAVGRPAVVSDYAQFRELPEDVAVRVPLGDDEIPALRARLVELLDAPERLAAMGEAARRHVARCHAPEDAAREALDACAAWAQAEPPGDRPPTVPPPTSLAWTGLAGRLRVEGAERGWPVGARRTLTVTLTNAGPARWLASWRGAGGLALEASLETPAGDAFARRPWLPLPRDLDPGESHDFRVEVRRPPGPCRLRLAVRRLDGADAPVAVGPRGPLARTEIGGPAAPVWERELA